MDTPPPSSRIRVFLPSIGVKRPVPPSAGRSEPDRMTTPHRGVFHNDRVPPPKTTNIPDPPGRGRTMGRSITLRAMPATPAANTSLPLTQRRDGDSGTRDRVRPQLGAVSTNHSIGQHCVISTVMQTIPIEGESPFNSRTSKISRAHRTRRRKPEAHTSQQRRTPQVAFG